LNSENKLKYRTIAEGPNTYFY